MAVVLSGNFTLRTTQTRGNLRSHRKWLAYLGEGDDLYGEIKKRFARKGNARFIQSGVRQIIEKEVYGVEEKEGAVYTPRTYALLRSFIATVHDGKLARINVISDYSVNRGDAGVNPWNADGSPVVRSGDFKGRGSYAIFFEDSRFKSFLSPEDIPVRPYFDQLVEFINGFVREKAFDSLAKAMRKNLPKQPKK